jgi:hypothetical protein
MIKNHGEKYHRERIDQIFSVLLGESPERFVGA